MKNIYFYIIFIVLFNCKGKNEYQIKNVDILFSNELQIGSNNPSEAMIYSALGAKLAKNGNIYVADAGNLKVKSFSKDGEFHFSFGDRGRGPGEFIGINGFSIIDSTIYLYDQNLSRLNVYNLNGGFIKSISLSGIASPIKIFPAGNSFIFIYPNQIIDEERIQETNLGHVYDSSFKDMNISFIQFKEVNKEFEEASSLLRVKPGSICLVDSSLLYFVPYIYSGSIYEYKKTNNGWNLNEIHDGLLEPSNIVSYLSSNTNSNSRNHDISMSSRYYDKPVRIILHSQSRGLLRHGDFMFHFTLSDIDTERVFGVEVYDLAMNKIGYKKIKSIKISNVKDNYLEWYAQDVDDEGSFYFMERTRGHSLVHILKFDLKNLQK